MRIGIDCRAYGESHGYMGKYTKNLLSYLKKNQDMNEYILFFDEQEWEENIPKSSCFRIVRTSMKLGSIAEQIFFPYELYKEKLDVMFFPHSFPPIFYFKKTITLLRDLASYFYPEKRLKWSFMHYLQNFVLRNGMRKAQSIIVLSEMLKRDIIEIFNTHEDQIYIIPPMYIDTSESMICEENEMKQFLLKEGIHEKYMLSIGDLREYKNIPRLLQAYNLLLKEWEVSMDIVLIWKEDPAYHEIRSILIELWLQNRVHIYNMLDAEKTEFLYKKASLYVLPSLYEGSEEVILAPVAHKIPLMLSSLPSITSFATQNDAVFFRPMSILEIKEALRKAILNPPLKQKERDMSMFSPVSVSTKILDIFMLFKEDSCTSINTVWEKKTNL